jgi:hypothetical protein
VAERCVYYLLELWMMLLHVAGIIDGESFQSCPLLHSSKFYIEACTNETKLLLEASG